MGACLSLCGDNRGPDAEVYRQGVRSNLPPDTEADRQARASAAEAAAQRQSKWEHSAVGKATNKAARAAREDRYQGRGGQDTAKDWLN